MKTAPPNPRFGGLVDGIANVVGKIDGNEFVQLIFLDGMGMILPRTTAEAIKRGPDAARETGIREVSGLVGNMFLAGWSSHLMLKLLGNRVNFYNPTGIPAKAWINAENLEAFSKLFDEILKDPAVKNHTQARELLIKRFVAGLASTNPELGKVALVDWAAQNLDEKARKDYLKKVTNGKLSAEAQQEIAQHFTLKPVGSVQISGTARLSEQARKLAESEAALQAKLGNTGFDVNKAYVRERLRLSLENLNGVGKKLIDVTDKIALNGGLTNIVNLHAPDGRVLVAGKKRHTMLQEFVHFLEQGIDRAADGLPEGTTEYRKTWQESIRKALFGKTEKSGLLAKILPQADEGLFTSIRKSKLAYTIVPVIMAVIGSISVAFYNNWLTQKKYGGKVFSPFEGGPPGVGQNKSQPGPSMNPGMPVGPMPGPALIQRNGFAQFQHSRRMGGMG